MPNKTSDRLAQIEKKLDKIEKIVTQDLAEDEQVNETENKELGEIQKLEALEAQLRDDLKEKPLQTISYRDFTKSAIGSFFGILGHFSFFYGIKISEYISFTRATMLYFVAFIIGALFLYFSGFRKVKTHKIAKLIPIRLAIIYFTSIATIIVVLFLYNFIGISNLGVDDNIALELYKTVSTISILAVMGAATADLIGGHSE